MPSSEAIDILSQASSATVIEAATARLSSLESWSAEDIASSIKQVGIDTAQKGKVLMAPLRAKLIGDIHGPDLPFTFEMIGKEEALYRLRG
jgi:glutamyl/glutaminyl-tRNA synthetase